MEIWLILECYKVFLHTKCLMERLNGVFTPILFAFLSLWLFNYKMAPKSSHEKHPATSSSSYDEETFPNAQCVELLKKFKTRPVVLERTVNARGLFTTSFYRWIMARNLLTLASLESKVFLDWVREFYYNKFDATMDNFKSFVRVVVVTLTPDEIAKIESHNIEPCGHISDLNYQQHTFCPPLAQVFQQIFHRPCSMQ